MDRRKDTNYKSSKLPREYLDMVQDVFSQNFKRNLLSEKKQKESFVVFGEFYPDEMILAVSLKNPNSLRMTTCYASIDFPPPQFRMESGKPAPITSTNAVESVKIGVERCVDGIASFFQTFFDEGRPVDYESEYRQDWTTVELDKNIRVFLRINHDNLELETQTDEFLEQAEETKKSKKKSSLN